MNAAHWKARIVYWAQIYSLVWPLFILPLTWWQYTAWVIAAGVLSFVIGRWSQIEVERAQEALRRASFRKDRIDPCTWVLYALEGHYISVGKAAEWLRDYIHKGERGPLPEDLEMLDESSLSERPMQWIGVHERLPELEARVAYRYEGGDFIGRYHGPTEQGHCFGGKHGVLTGDVTHWYPIPE